MRDRNTVGAGRRLDLGPDRVVREDWERDRAIVVGLAGSNSAVPQEEDSLRELGALAATAGAETVAEILQMRESPDSATYIGQGKVEEVAGAAEAADATLIVFDDELAPAQQRNLEKAIGGRRVLDRTQLILDIFAQHATTREGKVQVELAQLRYRLPRLRGRGEYLSRLGAGIGTRGPGETILEVDRRRILEKVARLTRELDGMDRTRRTKRKSRRASGLPSVSLVGYTNAGKSTLLNRLTDAGVLTEDKLFSTLDTTVRKLSLEGGRTVLLSDTVGFVRKLPPELVKAFHSTLEETAEADLLLHVVDASANDPISQVDVVRRVLRDVGAGDLPELVAWNKADRIAPAEGARFLEREPGSLLASSLAGEGIEALVEALVAKLDDATEAEQLLVPYDRGDVVHALRRRGSILAEEHTPDGVLVLARLRRPELERFHAFVTADSGGAESDSMSGESKGTALTRHESLQ